MNINIDYSTIFIAIIGSIIGGWASSYFQFRKWKRTEKASFMWEFRLKIFEAEKMMWDAKSYTQLNAPLDWLSAASEDPRVKIEKTVVDQYSKSIINGWRDLMANHERGIEEEYWGISTKFINEEQEKRNTLDKVVLEKFKKLKIG